MVVLLFQAVTSAGTTLLLGAMYDETATQSIGCPIPSAMLHISALVPGFAHWALTMTWTSLALEPKTVWKIVRI